MKKLIFFLALLCATTAMQAQVITAEEMLSKTDCMNNDCFGSFIEGKGFKYSRSQNYPNNQKMLTYTVDGSENLVSFMHDSVNNMTVVSFTTIDSMLSKDIAEQFTTIGFAKGSSENLPDKSVITTYRSRKFRNISLTLRTKTAPRNGADVTTHYITIQKG